MNRKYKLYYVNCGKSNGKKLKKFLERDESCQWRGYTKCKNGCYFMVPIDLIRDINITSKGDIYISNKLLYKYN